MMDYNRMTMGRMARELGFVRDTLEKKCKTTMVGRRIDSVVCGAD